MKPRCWRRDAVVETEPIARVRVQDSDGQRGGEFSERLEVLGYVLELSGQTPEAEGRQSAGTAFPHESR